MSTSRRRSSLADPCDAILLPGQIIAVSKNGEDSFLRGHGTYLETLSDEKILRASVTGTVQRVNKLISVDSVSLHPYTPQVGDLVVGRIVSIGNARWNVSIGTGGSMLASLPLSGVHLPGAAQRVKTAADALEMRHYLQEGDLVSAEVHKVTTGSSNVMLHTRSVKYGKLENGVCITVPAKLIRRSKTHYTTLLQHEQFQIILGCNGMIWIQRNTSRKGSGSDTAPRLQQQELAEAHEQQRKEHAETVYDIEDRCKLARLRASVLCLQQVLAEITPQAIVDVYQQSRKSNIPVSQMLLPENVIQLTAPSRRST